MASSTIDESQRKAAKVAGLAYLLPFADCAKYETNRYNSLLVSLAT
jgi:hypothetical protein